MKVFESFCVECDIPCMGKSCPNHSSAVYYCDDCKDYAKYHIEDGDYCEFHTKKYLQECFDDLDVSQKAELLNMSLREID